MLRCSKPHAIPQVRQRTSTKGRLQDLSMTFSWWVTASIHDVLATYNPYGPTQSGWWLNQPI